MTGFQDGLRILSELAVVASHPKPECLVKDDGEAYAHLTWLKKKWPSYDAYQIEAMDAILRKSRVKNFVHRALGLEEALLLYVDPYGNPWQPWLKHRRRSIVYPEKDACVNCVRVHRMAQQFSDNTDHQKRSLNCLIDAAKQVLERATNPAVFKNERCLLRKFYSWVNTVEQRSCHPPEAGLRCKYMDDACRMRRHLAREVIAQYLINKNNQLAKMSDNKPKGMSGIPHFNVLAAACEDRTDEEKRLCMQLIQISEVAESVRRYRGFSDVASEVMQYHNGELECDLFVLDAMLSHIPDLGAEEDLFYFNLPVDPIDLNNGESEELRPGVAAWSGFIRNTHDSNTELPFSIQLDLVRCLLTLLGQPVVRRQMEVVRRKMEQELEKERVEKEVGQRYKKHSQMLDHLTEPLNNITEALERMQSSAQRLRATLYEPSRGIFSAAPRVAEYFKENNTVGQGRLSWDTIHNPNTEDIRDIPRVKLTLAAVILEIYGAARPWPEDGEQLIERTQSYVMAEDPVFEPTRDTLLRITQQAKPEDLAGLLQGDDDPEGEARTALGTLKEILHRSYKEGESGNVQLAPLLLVLEEAADDKTVLRISFTDVEEEEPRANWWELYNQPISLGCSSLSFPVTRFSHWLQFIEGAIAYAKNRQIFLRKVVVSADEREWRFALTFPEENPIYEVPNSKDQDNLYRKMNRVTGESGEMSYHGNFMKPFMEFAMLVTGDPVFANEAYEVDTYKVSHADWVDGSRVNFQTGIELAPNKLIYSCIKMTDEGDEFV